MNLVYLGNTLINDVFLGSKRTDDSLLVPQKNYIIRTDANASSVTLAMPGTKFGSTFGQASYRSDISGYINGGSSIAELAATGSNLTSSTTTKWTSTDGYSTSIENGSATNYGTLPAATTNINFGSSPFTIEGWVSRVSGNTYFHCFFNYVNGCGFIGHNAGTWRFLANNTTGGETFTDYVSTVTNGTWYHWFLSRDANYWYAGLAGTVRAKLTLAGSVGTTAPFELGSRVGIGGGDTIRNQDFRVTKGVCRYANEVGNAYTTPNSIVTLS